MKRSQFAEGQIIAMLREQEARAKTTQVCRKHGISDTTFYKGKANNRGMVRRLKPLEGREHQAEEAIG
jgi:putative transposase